MLKKIRLILISIVLIFCFVFPLNTSSESVSSYLKQGSIEDLMDIMRKKPLAQANFNLFFESIEGYNPNAPRETGAVVLVKQAILKKQLDYWFKDMPEQLSIKFIKTTFTIIAIIHSGDISKAISVIEKLSVKKATEYAINWLFQNKVKIGTGELSYSFPSYKGNWQKIKIQYIIAYHSLGQNKGEIIAEFYSKNPIEPPMGTNPWGCPDVIFDHPKSICFLWDYWIENERNRNNDGKIEPFILRIKGYVTEKDPSSIAILGIKNYPTYSRNKDEYNFSIEIDFDNLVPEIENSDFILANPPSETSFKKEIIKVLLNKVKSGANSAKNFTVRKVNNAKNATLNLIDKIDSLFSNSYSGTDISEQIIRDQIDPWQMPLLKEPDTKLTLDLTEQEVLGTQEKIEKEIQEILVHQDSENIEQEQEEIASLEKMRKQLDYISKTLIEMREKTEKLLAKDNPEEKNDNDEEEEEEKEKEEILICSIADANHISERNKIIFNEIAWMGTKNSSNDEWIELKNISGSIIDMNNWQILDKAEIEGKSRGINIIFENATLSQGGFFLLERTDDTSVPNVVADLIYTGSLNNTDEVLYLFDENCNLQDKVEAMPDWISGSNSSKRTMERKTNFNWQTSENPEGTPKTKNSSGYYESSTETNDSGDSASVAGASSSGQSKEEPKISLSYLGDNPVNKEIDVGLSVSGLNSASYDIKISIEKDSTLSEIYYQNDWQSSHYYLPKMFYGNSFNGNFKLKIKKDKRDFQGQANIIVKIRENGKSKYWDYSNKINITESEEELIENQLPIAVFSYSPENSQVSQEITFDATSSTDPDGSIASYIWNFGDDSTAQIEGSTTNHIFSTSGQFQITLIVKDNQGLESNTFDKTIEILPIPKILISEIQIESSSSKKDEFIELYNPNNSDLDLTSWYLQRKTKTGSDFSSLVPKSLLSGKIIQAKSYFLIANASSTFSADVFTNYSITEDNVIFLKNPIKEVVDKVGFGQSQDFETAPTQNPPANKSIGRKWSITTEIYFDTDNNLTDFEIQTPTPKTQNEKDLTPPETTITSYPPSLTNQTTATFTFSSNEKGSTFQCQLDSGGWQDCLSPDPYGGLSNDSHIFYVKATDPSGNEDPEPAQYIWIIDTSVESPSLSLIDLNTSSTSFTNSQTVIVNISQDAEAAAWFLSESSVKPATSTTGWLLDKPLTFDLSINNGLKTVYIWTKDAAENVSQLGNSASIILDTIAPQTEIEDKPLNPTNQTISTFTFSSNEDNCIFECQLDAASWEDCSSSTTYISTDLSEGSHVFQVKTTDQAGNTDIEPAQYSWLIDLTSPSSQIESLASSSTSTSFNISWSGSDISSGILNYDIQYRDGTEEDWKDLIIATTSTSAEFTGQDEHTYYFRSRARDKAGNQESWSDQLDTFIKIEIPKDEIPPESISDLQAKAGENFREVILSWTTPKDNWHPYKPSEYIIKYGTEEITEENWALSTTTENVPATKEFNVKQEFIISDLDNNTTYYFAIKSKDNANNTSTISNSTSAKTLNHIPIAMFFYAPESPEIEEEITFDASDSYDIDGLITEYAWDFGNGDTATTTVSTITHTFNTAGDIQITLIIKDDEGTSSKPASTIINVAEKLETMLIISEVQIRNQNSANNDFIELFNPTATDIDISGFQLKKKSSTGEEYSIRLLPDNSIIPTQNHFLWVNSDYNYLKELADTTSTQTLARDNSIALLNKDKNIIDAVAWGSSTNPFVENIPFSQNPAENQSLGRRIDTENNYIDTDDNSQDFELQEPTPTNSQGEKGDVIPPRKVQDFQVASSTNNTVVLTWPTPTDPDTPTTSISYIVYWSRDEEITQDNLTTMASTTATTTTLTLNDFYYDSTYYFGIQAFDNLQYSALSTTTPLIISQETPQWQMFSYDPQRTFQCPYAGPTTSTLKWAYSLTEGSQLWTGPVVDQNGTIYIGTSGLLALKEENNQPIKKWFYNLDSRVYQTPIIGQDGTIYIIVPDKILAISPAGTLKWEIDINTSFSSGSNQYHNISLVMANNIIYYAASYGTENKPCLLSINPDNGNITLLYVLAEENPSNKVPSTPTIGKDGTVYISFDKSLFAFGSGGELKWQKIFELHQECDGNYSNSILNISIDNNKTIYFVVNGTSQEYDYCKDTLYAVSENFIDNSTTTLTIEEIKWEYNDKLENTEILVAESGNIYLNNAILMYGNWTKNILAINSEGDPIAISIEGWDNRLFTPKILDKNENIYGKYGTHYTDLMALILEEDKYWSSKQDSNFTFSFAITKNNILLAPSLHALYAFE